MQKKIEIDYVELNDWSELKAEDQDLVREAYKVCENAYAPYSKFKVGASLRMSNNEIMLGSNQENAAYPSGLCAERVALFHAGSIAPELTIKTICVVAKGDLLPIDQVLSPCGGCRQVMIESESRQKENIRVILVSQNKLTLVFKSVRDILPFAFDIGV